MTNELTGIVVVVTVSRPARIPTRSVTASNARARTGGTMVGFKTCGKSGEVVADVGYFSFFFSFGVRVAFFSVSRFLSLLPYWPWLLLLRSRWSPTTNS